MARYVDGFVLVIKKSKLKEYKKMAAYAGKYWMKLGALEYVECFADDLKTAEKMGVLSFSKMAKTKPNETVVFSFVIYKSKAHRDAVNKKIMHDPAMAEMCPDPMPFDMKKMAYGGFTPVVDLVAKPTRKKK